MNIRERLNRLDGPRQKILLLLIWATLLSVLWVWWDERTLPDIRGAWASERCETFRNADGASNLKRGLRVDEETWRMRIDFYADEDCANALFGLEVEGPYDLGPKSMTLRDATTARFDLRTITLFAMSPESAAAFEKAGCGSGGWTTGEGQVVSERGCLGLVPTIGECPVEYDIVKIEDGRLYFGDRSQGLCVPDRYPESFAPLPLTRAGETP